MRVMLFVCFMLIVLALGALEVVASHLTTEQVRGRDAGSVSIELAR
jgi:hypothetical protein